MLLKIFSVYDSKAGAFTQPFFQSTKGQAIRAFGDAVADQSHIFCKHPEDYTLFELGIFNDADGTVISHAAPDALGLAMEYVQR